MVVMQNKVLELKGKPMLYSELQKSCKKLVYTLSRTSILQNRVFETCINFIQLFCDWGDVSSHIFHLWRYNSSVLPAEHGGDWVLLIPVVLHTERTRLDKSLPAAPQDLSADNF
jgi:hypothetical protein